MAPRFLHREHVLVMVVPARSCSLTASTSIGIGKKRVAGEREREGERRSDSDRLRTVGSSSASGLRGGGGEDDGFVEGCEADPRIPTEVKGQYGDSMDFS